MSDINLTPVKNAHENRRKRRKGANGYLGAFVAGAYTTTVSTDPSLTYVRYFNGQVATAKHHNRINLASTNQRIAIQIGKERGELSVLDFDPDQAGALLEGDPGLSIPTHTHDGSAIVSGTVNAARLGVMTGDGGSGGSKGAVPAPAAGDATKFLKGNGTWATPSGGAGSSGATLFVGSTQNVHGNTAIDFPMTEGTIGSLTAPANTFGVGGGWETEIYFALKSKASSPGDFTIRNDGTVIVIASPLPSGLTLQSAMLRWKFFCIDDTTPTVAQFVGYADLFVWNSANNDYQNVYTNALGTYSYDITATIDMTITGLFSLADSDNECDPYYSIIRQIPNV